MVRHVHEVLSLPITVPVSFVESMLPERVRARVQQHHRDVVHIVVGGTILVVGVYIREMPVSLEVHTLSSIMEAIGASPFLFRLERWLAILRP